MTRKQPLSPQLSSGYLLLLIRFSQIMKKRLSC